MLGRGEEGVSKGGEREREGGEGEKGKRKGSEREKERRRGQGGGREEEGKRKTGREREEFCAVVEKPGVVVPHSSYLR